MVVILHVYYTIPVGFNMCCITFQTSIKYTNGDGVLETLVWLILLFSSIIKWFVYHGRSLCLYFNLLSDSTVGP